MFIYVADVSSPLPNRHTMPLNPLFCPHHHSPPFPSADFPFPFAPNLNGRSMSSWQYNASAFAHAAPNPTNKAIPPHWPNSYPRWPRHTEPFLKATFTALCFIGIGRPDLTEKWVAINDPDERKFLEHTKRISGNLSTINIVVRTYSVRDSR